MPERTSIVRFFSGCSCELLGLGRRNIEMAIVGSRKLISSIKMLAPVTHRFLSPTIAPKDLKDADDVVQPDVWARTV